MNKLTIFLLFSAVMLTFVGISFIPDVVIPDISPDFSIIKIAKSKPTPGSNTANSSGNSNTIESCDLSDFGLDCGITTYLEKNIAWITRGGKDFCSYQLFNEDEDKGLIYLWAFCQELYVEGGKIYEASGTSIPVKLARTGNGNFTHWIPRDGSLYDKDIRDNFPVEIIKEMDDTYYEKLHQINRERAEAYFKTVFDYKIEKTLDTDCSHSYECATPMEYMLQSRCPFSSACIDGKCTVICPNFHKQ